MLKIGEKYLKNSNLELITRNKNKQKLLNSKSQI